MLRLVEPAPRWPPRKWLPSQRWSGTGRRQRRPSLWYVVWACTLPWFVRREASVCWQGCLRRRPRFMVQSALQRVTPRPSPVAPALANTPAPTYGQHLSRVCCLPAVVFLNHGGGQTSTGMHSLLKDYHRVCGTCAPRRRRAKVGGWDSTPRHAWYTRDVLAPRGCGTSDAALSGLPRPLTLCCTRAPRWWWRWCWCWCWCWCWVCECRSRSRSC